MSNLNPGGLTRVLNYIKTWVTGLLNDKANSSHSHTKSQITDFPTIPSKTSQLTNDSGFLTAHQSLSNYSTLANTVKSISISGKTITVTPGSGSAYTLTTQDTVYTHPTTAGNKHIPSGGSANQYLKYSESGTAVWANLPTIPAKTSQLTNDSGYITSSGSCNYANSAGGVAWGNVSGKPSSYTPSSHNHDSVYLKLSGGTITGNISKNNAATSWIQGRNAAPFRTIAASSPGDSQYVPCWSAKSYQGSWDCGPYTSNVLHLSYITDANYNSGSNEQTADFTFATDGTFNAKVLKQNGTAVSLSGHTHDERYYTETEINTLLLNKVYPVGAIYLSVNSVNPGTLFGGTWEKIKDKFLLSSGDTYSIGSTGGNSSTTLKIANLPSHNHTGTTGNESQGHTHSGTTGNQSANHTHSYSGTTDSDGRHFHKSGHGWHNVTAGSDRHCLSDSMINGDDWSENITGYAGAHTHTFSGTTGGISANHTHDFTTGGISAHHTHSFTTSSVGSAESFSNMPPYLAINVWKRVA